MAEELLGGRYRLDHVVGHGGMATVFRAHDVVLDRAVAIKLMARRRGDGGVVEERFRREARVEARIQHPNVVAVHDVAESDDGRPYIVMDYVEGEALSAMIARGALDSGTVAGIGAGVARALAAAHEAGVVHRDVKPSNILVDGQGIPHLVDFGLAKATEAHELELTAPDSLVGTAHYVAPEQARYGKGSARADLYALGAVLYHCLAGEPPFTGEGPIDVALRRFEEDPAPLGERVGDCDPELAEIVHGLLRREAEERPEDAGAVAERLLDVAARLRLAAVRRAQGHGGG